MPHPPLAAALDKLPFTNAGTVSSSDVFTMRPVPSIYLEPEAPRRARWAWAEGPITPFKQFSYLYAEANATPPTGMRSAPPLGGLGSGTVELRADGSLRSWTIENASPAGSAKTGLLDEAAFGYRLGGAPARLLRTHPPAGLPGVEGIRFSGATPFTRLAPTDSALPAGANLRLYGRSRWRLGDRSASAVPAAGFTLVATNPTGRPLALSLLFVLPVQVQAGMLREGSGGAAGEAHSVGECAVRCRDEASCAAWSFVNATRRCTRFANFSAVPPAANSASPADGAGVRRRDERDTSPTRPLHVRDTCPTRARHVPDVCEGRPSACPQVRGAWGEARGDSAECMTLRRPGTLRARPATRP